MARIEPGRLPDSLGLEAGKFVTSQTYSMSLASNTSIYGTVYPKVFGILGLRHVVNPSISYSFTPAVKDGRVILPMLDLAVALDEANR